MFGFTTRLDMTTFEQALERVTAALKAEGFGILTEIDVQKAMKEKLGKDVPPQRILGACNPALAYQALQVVADVGLLLPCNVTVRQDADGQIVVGFLDPQLMVGLTEAPAMKTIADDANARLRRACSALGGTPPQST